MKNTYRIMETWDVATFRKTLIIIVNETFSSLCTDHCLAHIACACAWQICHCKGSHLFVMWILLAQMSQPHLLSWLMKYLSTHAGLFWTVFLHTKVSKPHLPSLYNDISIILSVAQNFPVENLFTLCHCKGSHLFVMNTIHPWSHPKNCWSHGGS